MATAESETSNTTSEAEVSTMPLATVNFFIRVSGILEHSYGKRKIKTTDDAKIMSLLGEVEYIYENLDPEE